MPAETVFTIKHHGCHCDKAPREVLFSWTDAESASQPDDGPKLVEYTIPEYFEAHIGLDYLDLIEKRGPDAALRWAIVTACGEAGWDALRSPGLDFTDFQRIVTVILNRIKGSTQGGPKAG